MNKQKILPIQRNGGKPTTKAYWRGMVMMIKILNTGHILASKCLRGVTSRHIHKAYNIAYRSMRDPIRITIAIKQIWNVT